jgi:uncharacterized protein with von Willebrand factor type A (vWA) domain
VTALPLPTAPFLGFATLLRANGFRIASEQVTAWLAAVALLGPRDMTDIRRAAAATLAPPPELRALFDALFDLHFLGLDAMTLPGAAAEEEIVATDDAAGEDVLVEDGERASGLATTRGEALARRTLRAEGEDAVLRRFARALPRGLPHRRGHRDAPARRGRHIDLMRSLRAALRHDGESLSLPRRRRRPRPRPILLLIDVSGSMKQRSDANLRFAHALVRAAPRIEVFTFGTRLTRVTRALRLRHREQALARAADLVADWDGGTRIGDALAAFLAVPRFAAAARGAVTLVVSDGLERGDPEAMRRAVARLAARSWRLAWLTPLAADPAYRPETAAMRAVAPMLDAIADGSSTEGLCAQLLRLAREGA